MPESNIFLDYTGPVDYKIIDLLLKKLKKTEGFINLDKTTSKRVYAIVVECTENIAKHSAKKAIGLPALKPSVLVRKYMDKILIRAGNPISINKIGEIIRRLNQVNLLDENALKTLYEKIINKEAKQEENGAGLGFILIKLKSGNKVEYNLTRFNEEYSYFELIITVNEYIMRKLIIDQTTNSPKVILDPDKNRFEISGESRPPDVTVFYDEILRWVDDYAVHLSKADESHDPVEFNLDFEYFNSSSAKYILDFCKQIGTVRSKGKNISIKWHYEDDDMDMLEVGREMSRMAKLPFEYIRKEIK
jgi:hypothetical protein